MLILSRTKNESIKTAGNIEIRVVEVRDNCVRLRIEAPSNVWICQSGGKFAGVKFLSGDKTSSQTLVPEEFQYTPNSAKSN